MKNLWFIKICVLLGVNSSMAQSIGLYYTTPIYQSDFFPDAAIENDEISYSYVAGRRGEQREYIQKTYYDYRNDKSWSLSLVFDDVFNLSLLDYFEFSYSKSYYDIVRVGDLVDQQNQPIFTSGSYGFYEYNLDYFGFALGHNHHYIDPKRNRKLYLTSNIVLQGQVLVNSMIYFSHRSPNDTGDPTGQGDEADNRLTGFNLGINTQHRIGYNFNQKITAFAGLGLGIWFRTWSRSNELFLEYLDSYEVEYGKLYKERTGPFPFVSAQIGLMYKI